MGPQSVENLASIAAHRNAASVTPSDTTDLSFPASALYIGVSGDVKVNMEDSGSGIVFKAVPVGILKGRFTRVYSNGTTATNIISLW